MSMNELQKQTNANIQAKANLIWEIATHLVGLFKPHEYGKVEVPYWSQNCYSIFWGPACVVI